MKLIIEEKINVRAAVRGQLCLGLDPFRLIWNRLCCYVLRKLCYALKESSNGSKGGNDG